jgi:ribosomal protein L15E
MFICWAWLLCGQGIVYGKPVNQGITQLKPNRNHRSMAEERVGRRCGGLRVLNSYWINQVGHRCYTTAAVLCLYAVAVKSMGLWQWWETA